MELPALTDIQAERLVSIKDYWKRYYVSPTVRELGEIWGGIRTQAVIDTLTALRKKGRLLPVKEGQPRTIIPVGILVEFMKLEGER